jgi:hypothetical protein
MTERDSDNPPSLQKRRNPNAYDKDEEANRKAGKTASEGMKPVRSADEERKIAEEARQRELEEQEGTKNQE